MIKVSTTLKDDKLGVKISCHVGQSFSLFLEIVAPLLGVADGKRVRCDPRGSRMQNEMLGCVLTVLNRHILFFINSYKYEIKARLRESKLNTLLLRRLVDRQIQLKLCHFRG